MISKRKISCILTLSLTALSLAACQGTGGASSSSSYYGRAPIGHYNENYNRGHVDIDTNLVALTKHMPHRLSSGQEYQSTVEVRSIKPIANAVVTDTIPENAEVIKTEPKADVSGNTLTWHLGEMNRGDITNLNVWLRATGEGEGKTCTTIDATPRTCHNIIVGKPQLAIEKHGPSRVRMGERFDYTLSVKNTGTTTAHNVNIVDNMPSGLLAANGDSPMNFAIGDLAPGDMSKDYVVHAVANERGEFCNEAEVTADNHTAIDAEACTVVFQEMIDISKTGEKSESIGKEASYTIRVHNSGDIMQKNVVVRDDAPAGTRISSAAGARVSGNTATWTIEELNAGESQSFNINLASKTPGTLCNDASVSAGNMSDSARTCTVWAGVPALGVEMVDTRDSLLIGETTQYNLRIKNQGTGADSNLQVEVRFPSSIKPTGIIGDMKGSISNNTVTFDAYPTLNAKEVVEYHITAEAVSRGNDKVVAKVKTSSTKAPVVEEESTRVY